MISLAFTGNNNYNSGKYWAIVLASIPLGIGQSIYVLTAPRMAITWYPKHKGLAMGITNCGAAIGGVSWPLIFDTLVEVHGFRGGVACLAGITGALAISITIFSIPAPEFKPHAIGDAYNFRNWWPTRAFRSKVFIIHIISMSFVYFGVLTIPFFVELWARSNVRNSVSEDVTTGTGVKLEASHQLGVYLVVTLNACQIPGRLFGSSLCDRFRARLIHAVACFVAAVVVAACWFAITTYQGALGFVALFGLALGVMVSLPNNDVQDLLGDKRTYLFGQYSGTVYTCCSPFVLSGAVVTGALVQYFGVQVAPAVLCMGCFVIAGCGLILGLVVKDDTACFEGGGASADGREGWSRINSAASRANVDREAAEKT